MNEMGTMKRGEEEWVLKTTKCIIFFVLKTRPFWVNRTASLISGALWILTLLSISGLYNSVAESSAQEPLKPTIPILIYKMKREKICVEESRK